MLDISMDKSRISRERSGRFDGNTQEVAGACRLSPQDGGRFRSLFVFLSGETMRAQSHRVPGKAGVVAGVLLALLAVAGLLALRFRDGSLRRPQAGGVLRIGYAVEAPYAFLGPSGEVTGESPEVARRIVQRLGIRNVQWRLVDFRMLLDELEDGRIDVVAAGMFITRERAHRVAFSIPTFHVRQGLLVRKGASPGLRTYGEAVGRPEVRLAVLSGSIEEGMLRRLGLAPAQIQVVPDARTGLAAVHSGLADGLALSSPTVRWMALQDRSGDLEMAAPFEASGLPQEDEQGYGAFAFRKGDRRLREAWDEALRTFIGSPEHQALVARFGFTREEWLGPSGLPGTGKP